MEGRRRRREGRGRKEEGDRQWPGVSSCLLLSISQTSLYLSLSPASHAFSTNSALHTPASLPAFLTTCMAEKEHIYLLVVFFGKTFSLHFMVGMSFHLKTPALYLHDHGGTSFWNSEQLRHSLFLAAAWRRTAGAGTTWRAWDSGARALKQALMRQHAPCPILPRAHLQRSGCLPGARKRRGENGGGGAAACHALLQWYLSRKSLLHADMNTCMKNTYQWPRCPLSL